MEISVQGMADWVVARINPAEQDAGRTNRQSYNVRVIAFNVATAGLILTGSLAVVGIISMYAAFVFGSLFFFSRGAVQESLWNSSVPQNQAHNRLVELRLGTVLDRDPQIVASLFANMGLRGQDHPGWSPIAHTAFGHAVWRNALPV